MASDNGYPFHNYKQKFWYCFRTCVFERKPSHRFDIGAQISGCEVEISRSHTSFYLTRYWLVASRSRGWSWRFWSWRPWGLNVVKTMGKGKIWRLACGCCEHGLVVGFADDFGLGCDMGFVCAWSLFVIWLCLCLASVSFFSFSFFHLCCCDLGLSFWLLGLIWEEHEEQVVMFLWKIIMISNNFLLLGFYSFAWVWFGGGDSVVIFWKKKIILIKRK